MHFFAQITYDIKSCVTFFITRLLQIYIPIYQNAAKHIKIYSYIHFFTQVMLHMQSQRIAPNDFVSSIYLDWSEILTIRMYLNVEHINDGSDDHGNDIDKGVY